MDCVAILIKLRRWTSLSWINSLIQYLSHVNLCLPWQDAVQQCLCFLLLLVELLGPVFHDSFQLAGERLQHIYHVVYDVHLSAHSRGFILALANIASWTQPLSYVEIHNIASWMQPLSYAEIHNIASWTHPLSYAEIHNIASWMHPLSYAEIHNFASWKHALSYAAIYNYYCCLCVPIILCSFRLHCFARFNLSTMFFLVVILSLSRWHCKYQVKLNRSITLYVYPLPHTLYRGIQKHSVTNVCLYTLTHTLYRGIQKHSITVYVYPLSFVIIGIY